MTQIRIPKGAIEFAYGCLAGQEQIRAEANARIAQLEAENEQLRAQEKHWRSNHDNVAARLRVFTRRPDLPKELADRLPWYRELVRLQKLEAGQAAPAARVPAPRYRLLVRGDDVIEAGDEFLQDDAQTWQADPNGLFVGMSYRGSVLLPARRAISDA